MRFPFRTAGPADREAVNARVEAALRDVEPMIYATVRRRFRFLKDEERIEEIVQKIRVGLWRTALPRYDASRHNKVSTFLCVCIANLATSEYRAFMREQDRQRGRRSLNCRCHVAPDHGVDRAVEKLADDVRANLREHLTPVPARIAARMIDLPDVTHRELSDGLDIVHGHVSGLVRQLKQDVVRLLADEPLIARTI